MINLKNIHHGASTGGLVDEQSNEDNSFILAQCISHLSCLETSDPKKFDEVMATLENDAKERGIDLDNVEAAIDSPAPAGILLPNSKSELRPDGKGTQAADKGVLITPKEGFVLKTTTNAAQTQKVFINICYSDMIDEPGERTKLDDEGKEVTGTNMPISVGPLRVCHDKAGVESIAVDCIVNPTILDKINDDKSGSYRDFVCQMVIQYVEMKNKDLGQLTRKYKLPKLKYHAYVDNISGSVVQKNGEHACVVQQRVRACKPPKIEIVERTRQDGTDSSKAHNVLMGTKKPQPKKEEIFKQLPNIRLEVLIEYVNGEMKSFDQQSLNIHFTETIVSGGKSNKSSNSAVTGENAFHSCSSAPHSLPHTLFTDSAGKAGMEVKYVHIVSKVDKNSIVSTKVDISAWMCSIRVHGFDPAECVVPYCIEPKSARCVYNPKSSTLTVTAVISTTKIDIDPDIGSPQWALSQGIRGSSNSSKDAPPEEALNNKYSRPNEKLAIRATDNDNDKTNAALENLPEDFFHANDLLSKCILDQQRKERQDKIDASEERKNVMTKTDDDVEHINVEDFRPGGKYDDPTKSETFSDGVGNTPLVRVHPKLAGLELSSSLWSELV